MTTSDPSAPPRLAAPARPDDAEAIAGLLEANAAEPTLLLQPAAVIRAQIGEFLVIRGDDGLRACAQLRSHRPSIIELMSVAVAPEAHGEGLGGDVVDVAVRRARAASPRLFWLATTSPGFFRRHGFVSTSMLSIPLPILLGKLPAVLRQPPRRWPAAFFGRQTFMRHPLGPVDAPPELEGERAR